jgi:hypothetical protein
MGVSSCKLILIFKSHPICVRMDGTTFRATWDDTGNVGVVNLTHLPGQAKFHVAEAEITQMELLPLTTSQQNYY